MLEKFLPKLITEEHRAYISGRSISDNILLVQEFLPSMSYSAKGGLFIGLEIDMERDYDHMS